MLRFDRKIDSPFSKSGLIIPCYVSGLLLCGVVVVFASPGRDSSNWIKVIERAILAIAK